jgi:hypothetical protein
VCALSPKVYVYMCICVYVYMCICVYVCPLSLRHRASTPPPEVSQPSTLNPQPSTLNPQPSTQPRLLHPKSHKLAPSKLETRNPNLYTPTLHPDCCHAASHPCNPGHPSPHASTALLHLTERLFPPSDTTNRWRRTEALEAVAALTDGTDSLAERVLARHAHAACPRPLHPKPSTPLGHVAADIQSGHAHGGPLAADEEDALASRGAPQHSNFTLFLDQVHHPQPPTPNSQPPTPNPQRLKWRSTLVREHRCAARRWRQSLRGCACSTALTLVSATIPPSTSLNSRATTTITASSSISPSPSPPRPPTAVRSSLISARMPAAHQLRFRATNEHMSYHTTSWTTPSTIRSHTHPP